jgi:hypothetical protein
VPAYFLQKNSGENLRILHPRGVNTHLQTLRNHQNPQISTFFHFRHYKSGPRKVKEIHGKARGNPSNFAGWSETGANCHTKRAPQLHAEASTYLFKLRSYFNLARNWIEMEYVSER